MKRLRVLLVDDHTLVRAGIRRLLEETGDIEVVGEADDGEQALRLAAQTAPQIMVLDLSMPGLGGLEVAAQLTRAHPQIRVIVLSAHTGSAYVVEALHCGAAGYLPKRAATEELVLALRVVAEGKTYLSPSVSRPMIDGYLEQAAGRAPLTARQLQVLRHVAEGRSSREIAERLKVSVRTVEAHRAEVMARLGVNNTRDLVHEARRLGLVS